MTIWYANINKDLDCVVSESFYYDYENEVVFSNPNIFNLRHDLERFSDIFQDLSFCLILSDYN